MHTGAHRCTQVHRLRYGSRPACDNGVVLIDSVQLRTGAQVDLGARRHPGDRSWQVLYRYFRLYVKYYYVLQAVRSTTLGCTTYYFRLYDVLL